MLLRAMKLVRMLQPRPDLTKPLLVTIGNSHYAEKARWCLDLSPLRDQYVEDLHTPAFHLSSTLLTLDPLHRCRTWGEDSTFVDSVQERHSRPKEKTGVPKLVLPATFLRAHPEIEVLSNKGEPIAPEQSSGAPIHVPDNSVVAGGSAGIMRFLADLFPTEMGSLYPPGDTPLGQQVLALDEVMDSQFGPAVTTWCFANTLLTGERFGEHEVSMSASDSKNVNIRSMDFMLRNIANQDVPAIEKFLFCNFGSKYVAPLMLKFNSVSAKEKEQAKKQIHAIFQLVDDMLHQNSVTDASGVQHKFLLGTSHMTAVDITFAALAAPVLMPAQMDGLLLSLDTMKGVSAERFDSVGCTKLAEFARELRSKYISAQYCLHLYENYRFPSSGVNHLEGQHAEEDFERLVVTSSSSSSESTKRRVVTPRTAAHLAREAGGLNKWIPKKFVDPNSCRPER